jgi:hypothetical protein
MAQSPSGFVAVPLLTELPVTPGREAILAEAAAPLVDSPRGFVFVVARLPCAPLMSLTEFPYSRRTSPQLRDVLAILWYVCQLWLVGDLEQEVNKPRASAFASTSYAITRRCDYCSSCISNTRCGRTNAPSQPALLLGLRLLLCSGRIWQGFLLAQRSGRRLLL